MDNEQLQQLATNATLSHSPPHLGVTTEAEKVGYLAQRFRESADMGDQVNDLWSQLETANERIAELESDLDDAEGEEKIKALELKVEGLQGDVADREREIESLNGVIAELEGRLAQQ